MCHLLGYEFMLRIRDLKDQQLYRIDRYFDYGAFRPLLTKTADLDIVEEQLEAMLRVALSLPVPILLGWATRKLYQGRDV